MSKNPGEFLTVDQTAKLLHCTPKALYSQRHRGDTPGSLGIRVGKRLLWRREDIDRWFTAQAEYSSTP